MTEKPERLTIEGLIYEYAGFNTKFPFTTEKSAKASVATWNAALWGRFPVAKEMGRFSAQKHEGLSKHHGKPVWGLAMWKFVGYTKEYVKSHPWVNYESKAAWKEAMEKRRK